MKPITISPLLLLGAGSLDAQPIGDPVEAAMTVRGGRKVIVPTPAILVDTLILLGASPEEARSQLLSHLAPGDDLGGLPQP